MTRPSPRTRKAVAAAKDTEKRRSPAPGRRADDVRSVTREHKGTLIFIGGREDKEGDKRILAEIALRVGSGTLVVATLASGLAAHLWEDYERLFGAFGIKNIEHLDIQEREQALQGECIEIIERANVIFFTGGDQLVITAKIGGTPFAHRLHTWYHEHGGTIAGTSAGASVMGETMIIGRRDRSHRVGDSLRLAPGLGLIENMIIDQHFAERGRIGRLLGGVAQNPRMLGVGVDEDTAVVVEGGERFKVMGSGAVYVVDGHGMTATNISEAQPNRSLSIFNVRLHLLNDGDAFDLVTLRPVGHEPGRTTAT